VTLPLGNVIYSLHNEPTLKDFGSLCRQQIGLEVDEVLFPSASPSTPAAKNAQIIPRKFFEKSQQRALSVVTYNIMEPHQTAMLKLVPTEPGDELWLMDQFYA